MKKHFLLLWMLICCLGGVATAQTVYITNTGDKYHTTNCRYLSHSKKAIELAEAIRQGYVACKVCKPKQEARICIQKNIEQGRLYNAEVVHVKRKNINGEKVYIVN